MSGLVVPPFEADEVEKWPTLGHQVCDLLEARAVFGPGSLRGQAYVVDPEVRAIFCRAYQVFPRGHPKAGRRRFRRVVISLRKGSRKTEIGAALAFAELHPEAPVRTDGWKKVDGLWQPVGRPVNDPYIPMVAYTEEQTEDLAYSALYVMCAEGEDADLFDIGLDRIMRVGGDGKALALAAAPDARDGARTTFFHADETHRFTSDRLREAHKTMLENLLKRPMEDPWAASTTTAYLPGEDSVGEAEHDYAQQVAKGKVRNASLFFMHREAAPGYNLENFEERRAAVVEASGPVVAQWSDVDAICARYDEPDCDRSYWERVWLNRVVASARQAFDPLRWAQLAWAGFVIAKREPVTAGFDGSRWRDATGFVVTDLDGHQQAFAVWEHDGSDDWQVPEGEVEEAAAEMFARWNVIRLYGDPAQGWDVPLARWAGRWGPKKVIAWYTDSRNTRRMALACKAYNSAIRAGELTQDGGKVFAAHIGHARRRYVPMRDEDDQPMWVIEKERRDSTDLIDLGMCGVLSWQARLDAIAAGEMKRPTPGRMVVMR